MMRRRAAAVVALGLASALLVSGCSANEDSGADSGAAGASGPAEQQVAVIGELAAVDGELAVGEELSVFIGLPEDDWNAENTDDSVVDLRTVEQDGASLVAISGIAPGSSTVVFTTDDGMQDEITLTVVDE